MDELSPFILCHVVDSVDQMMPISVCLFSKLKRQSFTLVGHWPVMVENICSSSFSAFITVGFFFSRCTLGGGQCSGGEYGTISELIVGRPAH